MSGPLAFTKAGHASPDSRVRKMQQDFDQKIIGAIKSSYFGGRAEVHRRREIVQCDRVVSTHVDADVAKWLRPAVPSGAPGVHRPRGCLAALWRPRQCAPKRLRLRN